MKITVNGGQRLQFLSEHKANIARLFPFWPDQLSDDSVAGYALRVAQMEGVVDRMRQSGLKNHWSYSLAEHENMIAVLKIERVLMRRAMIRIVRE